MIAQIRFAVKIIPKILIILLYSFGLITCKSAESESKVSYQIPEFQAQSHIVDGQLIIAPKLSKIYLSNPGIGWQNRPEKDELSDFPETVSYSDRSLIGWKYLNPSDGVYDWSPLDTQLENAVQNGKQYSFRVYTMVGEGFAGHMIPDWVIDEGATLMDNGEPDYSNCVYQEKWAQFVDMLIRKYDGNPNVAFVDISGYGDFNEWGWLDAQTEWDDIWAEDYILNEEKPEDFQTIDGQARRRLADMFIGGSSNNQQCRNSDNSISNVSYKYQGFQKTQLVMPFAGIIQSIQYVFSQRKDLGFRYDCLGWNSDYIWEKVGSEISKIWESAPIIFELCSPDKVSLEEVRQLTADAHASIVHDNEWGFSRKDLEEVLNSVGYRYFLKEVHVRVDDKSITGDMTWQNIGNAPSYPRMGQLFQLNVYFLSADGEIMDSFPVNVEISTWMPSLIAGGNPFDYNVYFSENRPIEMERGDYLFGVSIMDLRREIPINLAFGGRDVNGINILGWVKFP